MVVTCDGVYYMFSGSDCCLINHAFGALWLDGNYYTEAQCEAIVMCGNNHWVITPNLTRSIQIDSWSGQYKLIPGPNKDGRATDSCFGLVGPRQCGVLMVIAG